LSRNAPAASLPGKSRSGYAGDGATGFAGAEAENGGDEEGKEEERCGGLSSSFFTAAGAGAVGRGGGGGGRESASRLSARMDGIALRWSLSLPRGVLGFAVVLLGGRGVSVILWAACAVLLLPRAPENAVGPSAVR
jgi:hypothetical protein